MKVKDVTPAVIQRYVNDKMKSGLSANTVRKHLANISKCLDSAVKQNIIAVNPIRRIEMPKKERYTGAKHYNEKQIEQLLEVSKGDSLEIAILLTIFYGLRRSEILGLRWDAIDFESKTLAIKHTVVIVGKTVHKQDCTKNFALLLKKNNMPHTRFHDLRHSSASYLKFLGFDLKDIQGWLCHRDISVTMNLYTHLDMEDKSKIANNLSEKFKSFSVGR